MLNMINSKKNKGLENDQIEKSTIILLLFLFIIMGVIGLVFVFGRLNVRSFLVNVNNKKSHNAVLEEDSSRTSFNKGVKLVDNLNYSEALVYFEQAVKKEPENVSYLHELAVAHYKLKNYDEAVRIYEKLLVVDVGNAKIYHNRLGNIFWLRQDFDKAEFYFRKAIALDASYSLSYNNLALMFSEQGKKKEAIQVLQLGVEKSANKEELQNTLLILQK